MPLWTVLHVLSPDGGWHNYIILSQKQRSCTCQATPIEIFLQVKSNQITFIVTSPQHKCLGEWNSYERAPDSAEKQQTIYLWTDSAKKNNRQFTYGQTVQKNNNRQFTYGQTVQKNNNRQFTYGQTVQKKTTDNLHMDRQCKKKQQTIYIWTDSAKNCTGAFTVLQTVQKNNNSNLHMDRQCKKATAIYIWTVHIYRLYRRQCAKYTYIYSVHIVYYKDILKLSTTHYTPYGHICIMYSIYT